MWRKPVIKIAITSSLTAVASSAVAGETVSNRNYWPSEVAASRSQLKTALAGPLPAFGFDNSGLQPAATTNGSEGSGPHQGAFVPSESSIN